MPELRTETDTGRVSPGARSSSRFTRSERHDIFKRMVVDELARGPLPYRRRRKLMQYAAQIDIRPFDASLLIAEAQLEAGQLDPIHFQRPETITPLIHPERWPLWFKMTAAAIIVLLVNMTLIRLMGW